MSNIFKNSKIAITILLLLVVIIIQQSLNYKKTKSLIKNQAHAELINAGTRFAELSDGTGLVVNSLNNFAMFVDLNDGYVSQVIRQKGDYYQPEIASTLKRIIKPGDIVVHL